MSPGRTREPRRRVGLWSLGLSAVLHGALGALLWRAGPEPRAPDARPGPAATRVELFDARAGSGPGPMAGTPRAGTGAKTMAAPARAPGPRRAGAQSLAKQPPARAGEAMAQRVAEGAPAPAAAPTEAVVPTAAGGGAGAAEAAPVTASTGGGGGPSASGSAGSGGRAVSGEEGGSRAAIEALHRRLAAAALRCYPPAARRFRAHGQVTVSFCLDADGSATQVAQVASSGSALLDRAATGCVLPGALPAPGAAGCYQLPIVFGDTP